jgi:hypothetical protein
MTLPFPTAFFGCCQQARQQTQCRLKIAFCPAGFIRAMSTRAKVRCSNSRK